jgi:hypothetical protein
MPAEDGVVAGPWYAGHLPNCIGPDPVTRKVSPDGSLRHAADDRYWHMDAQASHKEPRERRLAGSFLALLISTTLPRCCSGRDHNQEMWMPLPLDLGCNRAIPAVRTADLRASVQATRRARDRYNVNDLAISDPFARSSRQPHQLFGTATSLEPVQSIGMKISRAQAYGVALRKPRSVELAESHISEPWLENGTLLDTRRHILDHDSWQTGLTTCMALHQQLGHALSLLRRITTAILATFNAQALNKALTAAWLLSRIATCML